MTAYEAKVGELEATQFSTTTKLKGKADFIIGRKEGLGSDDSVSKGEEDDVVFQYRYQPEPEYFISLVRICFTPACKLQRGAAGQKLVTHHLADSGSNAER